MDSEVLSRLYPRTILKKKENKIKLVLEVWLIKDRT